MGTQLHEPSAMTFSEAPLTEKWLLWFNALQQDIDTAQERRTHTLAEWSALLREFATRYVAPLDSRQEHDQLFQRLEVLESLLCPSLNPNDAVFSFASLFPRLEWLLQQTTPMRHEGESCIASVATLRGASCRLRIIGLLGLEEGVFPRKRRRVHWISYGAIKIANNAPNAVIKSVHFFCKRCCRQKKL